MAGQVAQLVYVSRPLVRGEAALAEILAVSRPRNQAAGITGTLVHRSDVFLQLLEGPRPALTATFARIQRDPRHAELLLLGMVDADFRLFAAWDMREDPMPSWMWSPAEVAAGAPAATPLEQVFDMLHRMAVGG